MKQGLTASERLVSSLSHSSFLRLWTHPNPVGKNGKELCDCLIICGRHVVIISVKQCDYIDTGDSTGWERWSKRAIQKSSDQIYGAERWLNSALTVERHDGRVVRLPAHDERSYHRVSVSLGGKGKVPLVWGDLGRGFVHVCDEQSLDVLFNELDTITDFVEFLDSAEKLVIGGTQLIFSGGGIEDLVALYIAWGHSFDSPNAEVAATTLIVLFDDLWSGFSHSNEYKQLRSELESSYHWDRLIEHFADDLLTDGMIDMNSGELTKDESALLEMALQPRGYRKGLADAFTGLLNQREIAVSARVAVGYRNIAFVFMLGSSSEREMRAKELYLRCFVVRGRIESVHTVVGIATDHPGTSIGHSSEILYIHLPDLSQDELRRIRRIQEDLGYFKTIGEMADGSTW